MGIDTDYAAPANISDPPTWTTGKAWRREYVHARNDLDAAMDEWLREQRKAEQR